MNGICLGFIAIGLSIILVKQNGVKQGRMMEKSKKAWMMEGAGILLIVLGLLIFTYRITDTVLDWLIISGTFFGTVGSCYLAGLAVKKEKFSGWAIMGTGLVMIGSQYVVVTYSIARDSQLLCLAMATALYICIEQSIDQSMNQCFDEKQHKKQRKRLLRRTAAVCFAALVIAQCLKPQTKPERLIRERMTDLPEHFTHIDISEGFEKAVRGKTVKMNVSFIDEEGHLKEIRVYKYFRGNIELDVKESF